MMEMKDKIYFIGFVVLSGVMRSNAQDNVMLESYRNRVVAYSQDIKAATHAAGASGEARLSAKADFLPKLSGSANFNYTGNPLALDVTLPGTDNRLSFEGRNIKYGTSLNISQPVYSGGALRAGYEKACAEDENARLEVRRVSNDVRYEADVRYWNSVAQNELASVAVGYRDAVQQFVEVVRQRVEEGYSDRNDLLMAEVRLNDADYQVKCAFNDAEVARLSLNALAGVPSDEHIATDSVVCHSLALPLVSGDVSAIVSQRPEMLMAEGGIRISQSDSRISNSRYMPVLSVGVDGGFSSPGYDFHADIDPNYAVYAKLSVPVFEWGKRRRTRRIGNHNVAIARERRSKIADGLRLEVETARCNYVQAAEQVRITESSLSKASESEVMAIDRYREGSVSVVDVINAQIYHEEARRNFVRSKLNACIAKSALERACGN